MILDWLFLSLIGLLAGVISGLLGIGGGVILVPALFFFFHYLDVSTTWLMHLVIGTSLASMVVTTLVSVVFRIFQKRLDWKIANFLALGIVIGSVSGAYLVHLLPSKALIRIFSLFLLLLAIYYFTNIQLRFVVRGKKHLPIFGCLIGFLSSLLGIGGGVVTLPILKAYRLEIKQAAGISSMATFLTSFVGSISYLWIGFIHQIHYPESIGYIYIPAFIVIGITTACTVFLGIKLSQILSDLVLKKIFSIALFLTAITMFLKTF